MMPPLDPKTLSDYKRYEQEHKISAQVSKYVGMFSAAKMTGTLSYHTLNITGNTGLECKLTKRKDKSK